MTDLAAARSAAAHRLDALYERAETAKANHDAGRRILQDLMDELAALAAARLAQQQQLGLVQSMWAIKAATYARAQVTPRYKSDEEPTGYEKGQVQHVAAMFRDGYLAACDAFIELAGVAQDKSTRELLTERMPTRGDESRGTEPCGEPALASADETRPPAPIYMTVTETSLVSGNVASLTQAQYPTNDAERADAAEAAVTALRQDLQALPRYKLPFGEYIKARDLADRLAKDVKS